MPTRPPTLNARVAAPDRYRGSASSRGYDRDWQRVRDQVLRAEPLCRFCHAEGRVVAAEVVDHIQTIRDRPDLRLVLNNLRPLCKRHHDERTGQRGRDQPSAGCDAAGRPSDPGHPWNAR